MLLCKSRFGFRSELAKSKTSIVACTFSMSFSKKTSTPKYHLIWLLEHPADHVLSKNTEIAWPSVPQNRARTWTGAFSYESTSDWFVSFDSSSILLRSQTDCFHRLPQNARFKEIGRSVFRFISVSPAFTNGRFSSVEFEHERDIQNTGWVKWTVYCVMDSFIDCRNHTQTPSRYRTYFYGLNIVPRYHLHFDECVSPQIQSLRKGLRYIQI